MLPTPTFTVTPTPAGLAIQWPPVPMALQYRVYAALHGQSFALVEILTGTSYLYAAPIGVQLYIRVYADGPNGAISPTNTIGPITRTLIPIPTLSIAPAPSATPLPIICSSNIAPATLHLALTKLYTLPNSIASLPTASTNFGDAASPLNTTDSPFNAAHLYESPGTYNISITLGSQTLASSFTVLPDTRPTIYASFSHGDDASPGTSANPVKTFARAISLLAKSPSNTRLVFSRGDTFDLTSGISAVLKNILIEDWGDPTAAPPILRYNGPHDAKDRAFFTPMAGSSNVLIRNLTFDSIFNSDTDKTGLTVLFPSGTNIALINCTFLNIDTACDATPRPTGLLIQNCRAPQITSTGTILPDLSDDTITPGVTGLRANFLYTATGAQYIAVYANTVADSTREHCIRCEGAAWVTLQSNILTNLEREKLDSQNISKGTIVFHFGQYYWASHNTCRIGTPGAGPLNRADWVAKPNTPAWPQYQTALAWRCQWIGFLSNTFDNATLILQPGAEHVLVRSNTHQADGQSAILINGYDSNFQRDVTDALIDSNTATNQSAAGRFFTLAAPNPTTAPLPPGKHLATNITLTNNTYTAPNLQPGTGAGNAAVLIQDPTLTSFTTPPSKNTWPQTAIAKPIYLFPGFFIEKQGYLTPTQWSALGATDTFTY